MKGALLAELSGTSTETTLWQHARERRAIRDPGSLWQTRAVVSPVAATAVA